VEGYTGAYRTAPNAVISLQTSTDPKGNNAMKLSTIVAGSAASVLLMSGYAFAQQQSQPYQQSQQQYQQGQGPGQPLSNREVRQFFSGIERDVNQMVQSGDLSRLRQWTQTHVADHAVLNRTNSIETEGHSRVISSVTVTKPDLLRLQRFVLSSMSEKLNNIDDFRLDVQVLNVEPVGDSAAIVKSRISERATLASRHGEGRMGQQGESRGDFTTGQGPRRPDTQAGEEFDEGRQRGRQPSRGQQGSLQIESQAICSHLVERNRDSGQLQIGMGVCDATTEAQL
jgi:hypothetical protein